ncbi:MAG: carbohydrate ABC transporter substrate-binding protein [Lachnospiraceae bacterium]|nr:carbohydrate ABC transporter substrate-binding protein [Lachnospiraceae bacterium]
MSKKRLVSAAMAAAFAASLITGCGSSGGGTTTTTAAAGQTTTKAAQTTTKAAEKTTTKAAASGSEGKVLNIQAWNEEFKSRMEDHYPGYEKVDATTGKIGDVTVKWTITPSKDNAYQNQLDKVLPDNAKASADDKVDIFLMEADYALKYVNADVTMSLKDLGISDSDISDQYKYTQDIVKDKSGNLKGLAWQACSAGLIYNRDAAKEVLGSDDPATVQEAVKDWSAFTDTAAKLKEAGYNITSTTNDTYRVYSNNVKTPWVKDGKLSIDDNIKKWVDDSKALVDAGETGTQDLWSDDWSKGFYPDGKVFCYFGPAWLINFSMKGDDTSSIAGQGGWGFCAGPQSFYWGGTWIAAATGTDNPTLVKDIMLKMTTDKDILKDISVKDADCVNSKSVNAELANETIDPVAPAEGDDGKMKPGNITYILGGQNPYKELSEGAEKVDMSNISDYDQGCNEEFQKAMKNYFDGNASYDYALTQFKKAVNEKYPDVQAD